MSEEDKKIRKHLVDEMMKVSKTNPDVMLYMQALMKNYEKLEQENKQLKAELKSANEEITWWSNRFNAVERDNRQLKEDKRKAREYIKENNCIAVNKEYLPKEYEWCCSAELLEILGDKE